MTRSLELIMRKLLITLMLLLGACTPGTLTPYAVVPSDPIQRAGYAQVDAQVTASVASVAIATQYAGETATAQPPTLTAIANAETATAIANGKAAALASLEVGEKQRYATATVSAFGTWEANQQQANANRAAEVQLIHNQRMQTLENNAINSAWWSTFFKVLGICAIVALLFVSLAASARWTLPSLADFLAKREEARANAQATMRAASANAYATENRADVFSHGGALVSVGHTQEGIPFSNVLYESPGPDRVIEHRPLDAQPAQPPMVKSIQASYRLGSNSREVQAIAFLTAVKAKGYGEGTVIPRYDKLSMGAKKREEIVGWLVAEGLVKAEPNKTTDVIGYATVDALLQALESGAVHLPCPAPLDVYQPVPAVP